MKLVLCKYCRNQNNCELQCNESLQCSGYEEFLFSKTFVSVCLDNEGIEEHFDLNIGYLLDEESLDKEFIRVVDRFGDIIECNSFRFKTVCEANDGILAV